MNYSVELNTQHQKTDNTLKIFLKIKNELLIIFEFIITITLSNKILINNFINFINNIEQNKNSLVNFPQVFMNIKISYYNDNFIFKFSNENNSFLFRIQETNSLKNSLYNIKYELQRLDNR